MRIFVAILSCLITLVANLQAADPKPNILLLLSDDHSYPYLSTYGDPNVKTPVLDQLAAEGIKFHRFFTGAPQCVPSRACYMTGKSPVAARMTRFSAALPRDEITLPELLRDKAGYYTGICGRSFHLDGSAQSPAIARIYEENRLKTFKDRVDFLQGSPDDQAAMQLENFLAAKPADKPFFMWANFSDPHHVWNAPAKYRPDPATLKVPGHWPDLPGVREQMADYCAEVNRLDETIGGVLEVLKKRGLREKTLIVFAGDNGQALPHGKGSLYDPGSNVPFVVSWPGVVKAGGDSRVLVSAEDLAPTLLAAAGIAADKKMTGVSILPLLKGESFTPRKYIYVERGPHGSAPVTLYASNAPFDLARAVRSDRYKLIYNCTPWIPYGPVDSSGGEAWKQMQAANAKGKLAPGFVKTYFTAPRPIYELYDLDKDPSELDNLSGQAEVAAVEKELREKLAEKMILDQDYLPLPALLGEEGQAPAKGKGKGKK